MINGRTLPTSGSLSGGVESLAIELNDVFAASQWRWEVMQMVPSTFRVNDWRATHGNLYSAIQLSRDLIGLILFTVIFVAAFNVVSSLMLVVTDRRKSHRHAGDDGCRKARYRGDIFPAGRRDRRRGGRGDGRRPWLAACG